MSRRSLGVLILIAVVIVVAMQAFFGLRIENTSTGVEFTTRTFNPPTSAHPGSSGSAVPSDLATVSKQPSAPSTSMPHDATPQHPPSTTASPQPPQPTTQPESVCPLSNAPVLYMPTHPHNEGVNLTVVDQLEALQGGPVPLDLFYGNTTPPFVSPTAMPAATANQSQADYMAAVQCQEVRGLPTCADGKYVFNIALSPGQIPARSMYLATEPISVHIYDEGLSEKGKRSSGDYIVVMQAAGDEDKVPDDNLYPENDRRKYKGRYGFSPSKVTSGDGDGREVLSMEIYAGMARWSTFRNRGGSEPGMRSFFSATYISYVSITSYKPPQILTTADNDTAPLTISSAPVVRWHTLGALPIVSMVTQAAYRAFRDKYFGPRGSGKEGLEDCLFVPPFDNSAPAHTMNITSQRRRFIMCGFGFSFSDNQMFIGEVTSRFEKGCVKNKVSAYDNEWIPAMDDPAGFNLRPNAHKANDNFSVNKNWNAIQCDHAAIRAQQHQRSPGSTPPPLGLVICLISKSAKAIHTTAFDMDARKVVASWESRNEGGSGDKDGIRNGKGVIPLLPHEIPQIPQQGNTHEVAAQLPRRNVNATYPKNLVLFHVRGGQYTLSWGMMDNHAPYALLNGDTSPLRRWRMGGASVEYVRSITLSQNRENVYFSYSDDDMRGKMCVVPRWRAVQASVGNLH